LTKVLRNSLNPRKLILIRCLTDSYYGLGHLKRCLHLAKFLKKNGLYIQFIITNNSFAENELSKNKLNFKKISNSISINQEIKKIEKISAEYNSKNIIIDMREYNEKICKKLQNNFRIILLDDAWTKNVYADLVFNVTAIHQYHNYVKKNLNCKIFLGPKYFITASQFYKHRKKNASIIKKKRYHIVITSGGTDPNKVSELILNAIKCIKNIKITVIVGPFSKNLPTLLKISSNRKNITLKKSPEKIWKIFNNADLVISAAGNTLHELSIQRIPTICIAAEEHQVLYGKFFSKHGFSLFLGLWKYIKEEKITKTVNLLLNNTLKRKKISRLNKLILNDNGTKQVAQVILQYLQT